MTLGRESQAVADGSQGFIRIAEEALCFLCFLLEDEICQTHSRFLNEFLGEVWTAEIQFLGDVLCGNRLGTMMLDVIDHIDRQLGRLLAHTDPLYPLGKFQHHMDAAYRLLENEQMPGWLFMPKNGATTIWESWEGTQTQGGIASLNHYSKGAVCEWLFKTMCGIRVDGENHFVIAPRPGGSFTYAKASYRSIYGEVESGWEKTESGCTFLIRIPENTSAMIILPDGSNQTVTAGTHKFDRTNCF